MYSYIVCFKILKFFSTGIPQLLIILNQFTTFNTFVCQYMNILVVNPNFYYVNHNTSSFDYK